MGIDLRDGENDKAKRVQFQFTGDILLEFRIVIQIVLQLGLSNWREENSISGIGT